jgi:UDP-galactopyranose mutase
MSAPIPEIEYLIVGSGLTGATLARILRDAGKSVLVVDRRKHMGGNVYDEQDSTTGIRFHTYGPHYFRTNSEKVWRFVNRFSSFVTFYPSIKTVVDDNVEDWPLRKTQVQRFAGCADWTPAFRGKPGNFEEACLAKFPQIVYEKFIKGYTEKQWGQPATQLSAELAQRLSLLEDHEYFQSSHRYSALPSAGYAAFMQSLLSDIPVILNFDYLHHKNSITNWKELIYTGPIDQYFDCDLGKLKYRGQQRELMRVGGGALQQPCLQLNNPSSEHGSHVRTIEWRHLMPISEQASMRHTLLTREYPCTPDDPDQFEYPMPDGLNQKLYLEYRKRADRISNVLMCGRLGEYRYFDMDQAIGRALMLAERLLRTNTLLAS